MLHFRKVCGCKNGGLYEARIFNRGQKYGDPWDGAFNVHIQGQKAHLSLLDRGWNRAADRETVEFLVDKGVKVVFFTRNGEEKVRYLERSSKKRDYPEIAA